MKKVTLLLVTLLFGMAGIAQNCENVFPTNEGTFIEMKSYSAKGKLTGTTRQTITDVEKTGKGVIIKVKTESLDAKGESQGTMNLEMRCENGVLYMDMKNFMNKSSMEGFEDGKVKIDGIDLEFPEKLSPGQTLKDGTMTMSFEGGGVMAMNMTVRIFNRKVDAIENITTPAGTFEAYKISYDIETKMGLKMTNKATQWYAKNVGAVRTETFDKNGKLIGYSEITELKK